MKFPDPIRDSVMLHFPIQSEHVIYDFPLSSYSADYVYNIEFHTHPLLLGRTGDMEHFRLTAADVDYVQLLVDGKAVSTVYNYYRDEPVVHRTQMAGIYSATTNFLCGDPIVTGFLHNDPVMRVVFWRKPVAPWWITYQTGNAPFPLGNMQCHGCRTHSTDGLHLNYQLGTLC